MACIRLSATCILLLSGILLLGGLQSSMEAIACPQYCLQVDYVTCASTGGQKLPSRCNCCNLKNCVLYLSDGTQVTCN
ncbi:uncharacterized protein [Typha latifolia]|uniref:uncharacterized protein n=1 Tax=Typha latifolia TaxID=4733 RepID=UPI003C2C7ADE